MGDLAVRIATHMPDVYRVATAGYAGGGSRHFPFQQYFLQGVTDFVCPTLPEVCDDFFGQERGIVLFIWDVSRVGWFSQPEHLGADSLKAFPGLKDALVGGDYEKWIYVPIDASGPNDKLTFPLKLALLGFDRILAYGQFGEDVIRRTIGDEEADRRHLTHLPHGINIDVFYELPRNLCRKMFFKHTGAVPLVDIPITPLADDEVLIGCCATNQPRKDWQIACETVAILSKTRKVRFWAHIDQLERNWSIPALLADYGILGNTVVSLGYLSDERMAEAYSACDVTIAPGLGEGMGYPIFESMFCGTPAVHANYGGAPQWMANDSLLVDPVAYRYEGIYACERPVLRAQDFSDKIGSLVGRRVAPPSRLAWDDLWTSWQEWLRMAVA